jgi:hypothetical protein
VLFPLASLLRLVSIAGCLIVAVSFALFAIDKTHGASDHQQVLLSGGSGAPAATAPAGSTQGGTGGQLVSAGKHKSSLRETVDDAANTVTSPFSGLTSGSGSEWAVQLLKLVLTFAFYGFGLGFLARVLRVRF